MANNDKSRAGGGIGFLGMLAILFIGLKLAGIITWPWWVVLLPLWGPFAAVAIFLLVAFAIHASGR